MDHVLESEHAGKEYPPVSTDNFLLVGIGASAGGIQALSSFFEAVTPGAKAAYVIILHLSPDHDSQLVQVLQTVVQMPVLQVAEKIKVQPGHVYVISPNKHLFMEDGHIAVVPTTTMEERRAPVDIFFRTLAETHGRMAVSVVLSGTGANGSMGLKRVKECGGAAFVQNPREAEFNEMPRNAIATGLIDDVLDVAEIPGRIDTYFDTLSTTHIEQEPEDRVEEDQQALREIFTQLRLRTSHDFSNYKRATLMRRIERRMAVQALASLPEYAAYSNQHPEETQALLKDLLISVTNFFRDKTPFTALEDEILPAIVENKTAEEQVRIWVAGCATGEEAYTIAMLCAERTLGIMDAPKVQIFATDIDEAAIGAGREGYYTLNDAADVSPERLARFFTREGDGYRIRREIRETILFAHHNFLKDPPFSRVDLISCRNVLIYLNRPAQERVMETFHFAMRPAGFLLLGTSESVDTASDLFKPFNREQHIYQARTVANLRSMVVPETVPQLRVLPSPQSAEPKARPASRIPYGNVHLQLLEQYAPPSIAVDAEFNIVHVSQRAGRYLEMGSGEPTQAVLKLIQDELRTELRNGLYQAAQKGTPVNSAAISVRTKEGNENIRVHVRPLMGDSDDARGHLLVVFEPATDEAPQRELVAHTSDEMATRHLEEELARLRAQLRASNEQHEFQAEELKAGNEELQAMNEELRSATEELETSKEELQSINEELSTVNQELKVKVEEATMVSNNLQNLINSTDIGTIFLDRSLRVVLFTPAARTIFNLIPADFGRPLSDITSRLEENTVLDDAQTVLRELQRMERETRTTDGRMLLVRISPYRTEDDRIQGVVISLLDVTERRKADEAIRRSEEKYRTLFTNIDEGFGIAEIILDNSGKPVDYRMLEVNKQFETLTGQPAEKFLGGRTVREVAPELEDEWYAFYGNVAVARTPAHREVHAEAWGRWFDVSAYPVEAQELRRIAIVYREITERKRREANLAFLANLQAEFAPLASSEEIMRVAGERIADYFKLTHCLFVDVDERAHTADVIYDMCSPGGQQLTGRYTLPDFHTEDELQRLGEGQSLVLNDVRDAPRPADAAARFESLGTRALVTAPYRSGDRWKFALSAQSDEPRTWREDERNLLEELAARIYIRIERARAEEALRESEEKYRRLFNSIDEGFQMYELLYDDTGKPLDFRYLETNPAFERQTGLKNVAGKLASEVIPNLERHWFDYFDAILRSSEPSHEENYHHATDKWYHVSSFRATNDGRPIIAALFTDITERKQRERQGEFLLKFSDALRTEQGADAVAARALEMLVEELELDRSYITTYHLDENRADLDYQIGNDTVPPLPEHFVLSDYPEAFRSTFDRTFVIDDELERQGLSEAEKRNAGDLGLRAMMAATLRKENKPFWSMVAINSRPRRWTAGEIALIEAVAERTWAAIERAKAEATVRESEKKYRTLFEGIDEGVAIIEVFTDEAGRVVDLMYRDANAAFERQSGMEDVVGKRVSDLLPHLEPAWLDALTSVIQTGEPLRMEGYAAALDRWVETYYSRVDDAGSTLIAAVFNDITERKRRELNAALLDKIGTDLSILSAADEIMQAVGKRLCQYLKLSGCYFVEVDEAKAEVTVHHGWGSDEVPSLMQTFNLEDYLSEDFLRTMRAGEVFVMRDTAKDSRAEAQSYASLKVGGFVTVPFFRNGRYIGHIAATTEQAHDWQPHQIQLLEEISSRIFPRIERARAEDALRKSELKYRTLFDTMEEGLTIFRMIRDDAGVLTDMKYEALNNSVKRQTGIDSELVIGRLMSGILPPEDHQRWLSIFNRISPDSAPLSFEEHVPMIDRWFIVSISSPIGDEVAVFYRDITERKHHEQRQNYLLRLSDVLRSLTDIAQIKFAACKFLGTALGVTRVYYAEVSDDDQHIVVERGYAVPPGLPLDGRFDMDSFGTSMKDRFQKGETVVYENIPETAGFSAEERNAYAAISNEAMVICPLIRNDRFVATLSINNDAPRVWSDQDVFLVKETAARLWTKLEQARAEVALRGSEKRFYSVANLVPDLLWDSEPDGSTNWYNDRWLAYTGQTQEQAAGWGWLDAIHPDDRESSAKRYAEAIEAGEPLHLEHRIRRFDGTYCWFVVNASPIKDPDGRMVKMYGAATNIHDRKQAEEALRKSEANLATELEDALVLQKMSNQLVSEAALNGHYNRIVAVARTLMRSDAASIQEFDEVNSRLKMLAHSGFHADSAAFWAYVNADVGSSCGRALSANKRVVVPDMAQFEAEPQDIEAYRKSGIMAVQSTPLVASSGRIVGMMSTHWHHPHTPGAESYRFFDILARLAADFIERAHAEAALRESEERYRVALQSANMAAWDWDIVNDEIRWNDQHFLLLGLEPENRALNAAFFLQFIYPEDQPSVEKELSQAVSQTGLYRMEAFRVIRVDNGSLRWMTGFGRAIAWQDGKAVRMVGVMYDITERKLLEQQKDEFIGIASHELRTPVTSIKAYAEVLQERFEESNDTHSVSLMRKLDVQVDRLTSLIYSLLDTTRIVEGKLQLERTEVNIDELIRDTAETLLRIAGKHRIELDLQAKVVIAVDQERVRQVFVNLITNAIKYSPKADKIVVTSTASASELRVCVQDFGIGISEASQLRVFDRFFRDKDAGTYAGLGLGLFISASIIREHGGRIFVESQVGGGSLFCITLPLPD